MSTKRGLLSLVGVLAVVLIAGCGPSTIGAMKSKPAKYDGKRVTIVARVIDTKGIPLTNHDYYKITDDSGEIWVQTTRGVPLRTVRYRIEGTFRQPGGSVAGLLLGDYIIREEKREEVEQ